jgi:hypothetical protein
VQLWLKSASGEIESSGSSPAVQKPEEIERDLGPRIDRLHQVANRLYDRWIEGLSP